MVEQLQEYMNDVQQILSFAPEQLNQQHMIQLEQTLNKINIYNLYQISYQTRSGKIMINPNLQNKINRLYQHRDEKKYLDLLQKTINKYDAYLQYHIPFTKENVQVRAVSQQINGVAVPVAFLNIYKQMMQHFKPQHFIWGFFSFVLNSIIYHKRDMRLLPDQEQNIHRNIIKSLNRIRKFSYQFSELQRDQTKILKINNQSQMLMNQILDFIYSYYGDSFQLNTTDFIINTNGIGADPNIYNPIDFVDHNEPIPQDLQNNIQNWQTVPNNIIPNLRDQYNCQINIKRVENDILHRVFGMQKRPFQMIPADKNYTADEINRQGTVLQNMTYAMNVNNLVNVDAALKYKNIQNFQNIRARYLSIRQGRRLQLIGRGYFVTEIIDKCRFQQPGGDTIYKIPIDMNQGFFLYPNIKPMEFNQRTQNIMKELGDRSDMLFKYNFLFKQQITSVPYKKLIAHLMTLTDNRYERKVHDMINLLYKCVKNGEINMDQLINYINQVLVSSDNISVDYENKLLKQFQELRLQNIRLKYIQQLKNALQKNQIIYKFYELSVTNDQDQNYKILTYLYTLYVQICALIAVPVAVEDSSILICCGQLMSLIGKKISFQEIEGLVRTENADYNYNLKHKYMLLTSPALLGYQTPLDYLQRGSLVTKIINQRNMARFQMNQPQQILALQPQNPPIQPISALQLLIPSVISISMSVLIILYRRRQVLQQ